MNKAVLWDRDGVLNFVMAVRGDGETNVSPQLFEDFKLNQEVLEVLKQTKLLGFLNIIHTNQPDIARSKMSWDELNKMHDFLTAKAPEITAIYVCPHDDANNCNCRKPRPGLILDAAKDYHLDLSKSFLVGDGQKDIDAAKNAGVKSILLRTNYNRDVSGFDFEISSVKSLPPFLK